MSVSLCVVWDCADDEINGSISSLLQKTKTTRSFLLSIGELLSFDWRLMSPVDADRQIGLLLINLALVFSIPRGLNGDKYDFFLEKWMHLILRQLTAETG
jgi:hypothetical protein